MTTEQDSPTSDVMESEHQERDRSYLPSRILDLASRFGGPGVLFIGIIVFTFTLPGEFLTTGNIKALLTQQAVPIVLSLGLLFPLVAGEFDFSGGSLLTLSATLLPYFTGIDHLSWPIAVVLILVISCVAGLINGVLVAIFKYNSFVATLATGGILSGMSLIISNGATLYAGIPNQFTSLGRGFIVGIPDIVVYAIIVFLIVAYVLRQTVWGRYHEAIGKGRSASQLAGISISRHLIVAFMVSAMAAGLAGVMLVANLGSAPPAVGGEFILAAFAAVFLGSTMFRPGFFNAVGTVVAGLLVAVGVNGLSLFGVSTFIQDIYTGVLLIIAVGLSRLESASWRRGR